MTNWTQSTYLKAGLYVTIAMLTAVSTDAVANRVSWSTVIVALIAGATALKAYTSDPKTPPETPPQITLDKGARS